MIWCAKINIVQGVGVGGGQKQVYELISTIVDKHRHLF